MRIVDSQRKYGHLIWTMAKTDFSLRYHGSILGYLWSLLQPLLIFAIMYFVFSSIFARGAGSSEHYALELLTALMVFNFFSEATTSGMKSLAAKKSIIKKIYVPLWTIVVSSAIHAMMVFGMNTVVIFIFFSASGTLPSIAGLGFALLSVLQVCVMILAFSFFTAPLFVKYKDLEMIWTVGTRALLYASPIIYPLSIMPENVQQIILLNPIAFLIHFMKEGLIYNHFPDLWQALIFNALLLGVFAASLFSYRVFSKKVTENI